MLKHMSSRSDSRNSIFEALEDLDKTEVDDLQITDNDLSKNHSSLNVPSLRTSRSFGENDITNLLSKPEIQRIILRRKSDLIKKELIKLDESISEENRLDDYQEADGSEGSFNSKEIIQEVQLDNSTYLVHKRKKDRTISLAGSTADTSSEQPRNNSDIEHRDIDIDKRSINVQKDYWTSSDMLPPVQPLASSSPSTENYSPLKGFDYENKRQNKLERLKDFQQQNSRVEEKHANNIHSYTMNMTRQERPSSLYLNTRNLSRIDSHCFHRSTGDLYLKQNQSSPSTQSCVALNRQNDHSAVLYKRALSTQTLMRKDKFRQSKQSISASSSISNIPPNITSQSCACSTVNGRLSQINEEMEHENNIFVMSNITYQNRIQKCKCFAIFFVALAIISCIVGGFLHFYVGQFPEDVYLNQGDIKLISISSLFCSGVKATSDKSEVRLIAFNQKEEEQKHIQYTRKTHFKLRPLQLWKRQFYLIAGSEVTISIRSNYLVDVIVFEGEKSFSLWSARQQSETYIMRELCCSNKYQKKGNFSFTAKHTDRYFIVIYNHVEVIPVDIHSLELKFKRISYMFSRYSSSCDAKTDEICLVEYSFNTKDTVAIEVPLRQNHDTISTASTFRYECKARIWFYCLFFIAIFVAVFVFTLICYYLAVRICIPSEKCCCYKDNKRKGKFDIVYYNNLSHHGSQLKLTNDHRYLDTISYSRSIAASRSDHQLMLSDNTKQCSRAFPRRQTSRASSYKARSYREMGITNDIAAIYKEEQGMNENADSGISVNPDIGALSTQSNRESDYNNSASHKLEIRETSLTRQRPSILLNKPTAHILQGHHVKQTSFNRSHNIELRTAKTSNRASPANESFSTTDGNTTDLNTKTIDFDNREIFI